MGALGGAAMKELYREERLTWEALWQLFRKTARSYTQGDSATLSQEMAEELLRSLQFTLDTFGAPAASPEAMLEHAQQALEQKTSAARVCWQQLCKQTPALPSEALHTSLDALGTFFRLYDMRHFAHEIPCMIDYPTAVPVQDSLKGICWVERYLWALQVENRLLCAFPVGQMIRLMDTHCVLWRETPVNVFLPVLANAAANQALYGTLRLPLSPADASRSSLISSQQMCEAVEELGRKLGWTEDENAYALCAMRELLPRLRAGDARGVVTCM